VTASEGTSTLPLCVDLDGTLIRSDALLESLTLLIKRNPLYLFCVPIWLLAGKARLKAEVAKRVELDPAALPYNREFIQWLESERSTGRQLWLCTASNERLASSIAAHLKLFDGVLASDDVTNLVGGNKAERLVERFGDRGFDYCGNESRDLIIWKRARAAIVVDGGQKLEQEAARQTNVVRTFSSGARPLPALIRALRPHQWAKNALIVVPVLAAHLASDSDRLERALIAVVAFCLCASSVYIINDLLDLAADRAHRRKSKRPFAAGDLSLLTGWIAAPLLLIAAIFLSIGLPGKFQLVFAGYYVTTLAYSFGLKGRVLVDTLTLAALYTLRIIAGAAAASVPLSFWLLIFSVFLFLSLAFAKRFTELDGLRRQQRFGAAGRGYHVEDLAILQSFGTAAGYLSVLVLALYINSPDIESLYRRPKIIWLLCVLMLYWVSRVWMKAQRGELHDDPVVFALKDRVSLGVGLLVLLTIVFAV
jgi:4-hydroxybenzoate polyprenyltransferase